MPVVAMFLEVQLHGLNLTTDEDVENLRCTVEALLRSGFGESLEYEHDLDVSVMQIAGTTQKPTCP